MDVVGAEAGRALGKFFNRRQRHGADDDRIGLFASIHHPGELGPIFALGTRRFIGDDQQAAREQWQDCMGEAGHRRMII